MTSHPQSPPDHAIAPSRLPDACFLLATTTVLCGMCLGAYMGINQDFTLAPAHAHMNLLGWVSLFMFGLYYRTHQNAVTCLARLQIATFVAGYLAMAGGMVGMFLVDHEGFLPVTVVGSLLLIVSVIQFLVIAWLSRKARSGSARGVELVDERHSRGR